MENLKTKLTREQYEKVFGTSFHDVEITTTVAKLKKVLGEPDIVENTGRDKSNFQWVRLTSTGIIFSVYDYKEYRKLKMKEDIEFHIGGHSFADTQIAQKEIMDELSKLNK